MGLIEGRPKAEGDTGVESRLRKGLQRVVALGTPGSRPAGWLVGGWLKRKGRASTGNSEFGSEDGGNRRSCSSPILSQALQAMPYAICKRQSPTKDRAHTACSDGQAHLSVFVFSACQDLPVYFPLWIGF